MFEDFDFSILNDPSFKEDAVREEIIAPIIRRLGYTPSGDNKVIRSKSIKHPFCYIGTIKRDINIIPDYLLQVGDKNFFVIDAKAPNENIAEGKNVEQCYSYAIHSEIRTPYYALCNGRQISIFQIQKYEPIVIFDVEKIEQNWNLLERHLSSLALTKPHIFDFYPDFGLSILKFNMGNIKTWVFIEVRTNLIMRLDEDNYTFTTLAPFGENEYALTFDFNKTLYQSFLDSIDKNMAAKIDTDLKRAPFNSMLQPDEIAIGIKADIGKKVESNGDEDYLPFSVTEFFKVEFA